MSKYAQEVVHIEIKWYPKVDPFFHGVSNHACKKKFILDTYCASKFHFSV